MAETLFIHLLMVHFLDYVLSDWMDHWMLVILIVNIEIKTSMLKFSDCLFYFSFFQVFFN